ncbi:hypothetical protein FIV42_20565 [Persicimonas caeni]|jgi:hypothetical protein|uniref:Tetratricopeptide repeat protein n=1 Tax=Persicimonas caeni TaxID=2292766 RepID=A0A4Y6PY20_PERCE|nr:hypothetical protein [Persicimonas caeni]QDG53049.1 hypothetical protein FIV42_20565 [Persicimonas caeni]QED34271.1 hypothetical protein FRD00_20560 [Persicimonas caeni]
MNNDTTIEVRPHFGEPNGSTQSASYDGFEDELRWTCLKLLSLIGKEPPARGPYVPRQLLLYAANRYRGVHEARFEHMCRGMHLMSERRFREALRQFEVVLSGRVDAEFEPLRELALEAHATCLQQLDYDDEALEEFTRLLHRKFTETRDSGEADHVAKLLGLARMDAAEERFAPSLF